MSDTAGSSPSTGRIPTRPPLPPFTREEAIQKVRFAYESLDATGRWYRSYGNENWEFDKDGLMQVRHASINDLAIAEEERNFHWPLGRDQTGMRPK